MDDDFNNTYIENQSINLVPNTDKFNKSTDDVATIEIAIPEIIIEGSDKKGEVKLHIGGGEKIKLQDKDGAISNFFHTITDLTQNVNNFFNTIKKIIYGIAIIAVLFIIGKLLLEYIKKRV